MVADLPLYTGLILPLARLVGVMVVSLLIAQAVETFHWTRYIAKIASPLIRLAHLPPVAGAAFSFSFASPSAANAMLAQGITTGTLDKKGLLIANIVNSTPAFFVHLPSLLAMAYAFLGAYALPYVGLVFAAAMMRTMAAVCAGRMLLPPPVAQEIPPSPETRTGTLFSMLSRLQKRLLKICLFTIPIYCLIFLLQQMGAFASMQAFLAAHLHWISFLHPASLGVIALFVAADNNAAFAAAAALIHGGTISPEQAVATLLIGNILSSPMRAFRHQLPAYAGYFSPSMAMLLVGINQSLRAASLVLAVVVWSLWL